MVSVNRRFMPFLVRASEWARAQGPLRYVRASMARAARSEPDFVWSTALHAVDALRSLAGEVADSEVRVLAGAAPWYVLSLTFESGAEGSVEVLPTAGVVEESYELYGDGFRARVVAGSGSQRSLELWRDGALAESDSADERAPEDARNGAYGELAAFVAALRSGARPGPEIHDVLPSARIVFRAAAKSGVLSSP